MLLRRVLFVLLCALFITGLTVPADAGPEKVSPLLRSYTHPQVEGLLDYPKAMNKVSAIEGIAQSAQSPLGIRVLIHGDVTRADLEALGVTVTTQAGNVFAANIPEHQILAVSDLPGIIRVEASRRLSTTLDVTAPEADVKVKIWGSPSPPYPGNSGAGILVGSCDSGYDYTHDDFRTGPATSRFLGIWDQNVAGTPPAGFSGGRLWSKATLDAQTSTHSDPGGHGTHVMGIAAGNGRGGIPQYKYTGMAPDATLIGVATDFSDAGILDGVNWMFQQGVLNGMPTVVNLSLGGHFGPHDGTDPFEVGLDALTGPGKLLAVSAGNERADRIHAQVALPAAGAPTSVDIDVVVDPYAPSGGAVNDLVLIDGYYESTDNYTVAVIRPNGSTAGTVTRGNFAQFNTAQGAVQIDNGTATSATGDFELFVAIFDAVAGTPPAAGTWKIRITRVTSTNSNIDLWMYFSTMGARFGNNFTVSGTVGSPGVANQAITVGAYGTKFSWLSTNGGTYSWNECPCTFGSLASFSSAGPTRDGRTKPEISAPGFGVMSTLSDDVAAGPNAPLIDPDNQHWMQTGTSMSCPVVAGVLALMLAKDPTLTPATTKTALQNTAFTDGFTGAVPNNDWGYGKLRATAADLTDPSVTLTAPNGGENLTDGSSSNITWSASDNVGVTGIELRYSTDGGATYPNLIATGLPNTGTYSWTVPLDLTTTARVKVIASDACGNGGEDASNADFEISHVDVTPPTVAVTQPNGGESLPEGSSYSIQWSATDSGLKGGVMGAAATISGIDSVRIEFSDDNGAAWVVVATGLDNTGSYSWTVPAAVTDSALVRVTAWDTSENSNSDDSDNVFSITSTTGVGDATIPVALTMAQSRPNPMRSHANIRFGLAEDGWAAVSVFDAAGRQIAQIANGSFPAGYHSVGWNGKNSDGKAVSAGIYFYRLDSSEGSITRKLMVLR